MGQFSPILRMQRCNFMGTKQRCVRRKISISILDRIQMVTKVLYHRGQYQHASNKSYQTIPYVLLLKKITS